MGGTTIDIQDLLDEVREKRPGAVPKLMERAYPRLGRLAGKMIRVSYPDIPDLEAEEVIAEAYAPLARALESGLVSLPTPADFFRFAAFKFRQTLTDMAAKARARAGRLPIGPADDSTAEGGGLDPGQTTHEPAKLATLTEFHEGVEGLPDDVKAVFVQHYYLGLHQADIARAEGLTPKQVSRLWLRATVALSRFLPKGS